MKACLACGGSVKQFMDFGKMPIANGFLSEAHFSQEQYFNLAVGFCPSCTMVQLMDLVDRDKMFHEHYAFFSSTSRRMEIHFEKLAGDLMAQFTQRRRDPFVVEIGSNDGIFLRHFAGRGIRHLGIEPSRNVAQRAAENGITTLNRFFDEDTARQIRETSGKADIIYGANVMCHIPYMHSIAKGVVDLMADDGMLIFEDPYVGDIVAKTSYDQIYDEHAFYFSVSSVENLFGMHGLEVIDITPLPVHGGSMRYCLARRGRFPASPAVAAQKAAEKAMGLSTIETFERLALAIEDSRRNLVGLLTSIKGEGHRIAGYGATSKSTTVLNYCGIGPEFIDFISDTTPTKQGLFTPGKHIAVKPYSYFLEACPAYTVLFAWNHGAEILEKEQGYFDHGGRFILYVPRVEIIESANR